MTKKRCPGCGSLIQSSDSNELGYVPDNTAKKAKYCQRCFKIIHYNESLVVKNPPLTKKIIDVVNKKGFLAFFLVDFLNINKETLEVFKSIKISKCLVISKFDIIPRSIGEHNIKNWLKIEYEITDEIIFVSAERSYNVSAIEKMMDKYLVDSAYLLGFTNAGKSSLINAIYKNRQKKESPITVSSLPNTTIDFINLNIGDGLTLTDSPGLHLNKTMFTDDDIDLVRRINSKAYLRPITYQMKFDESIILENKYRFEYKADDKNSFTFYMSDAIELDKIFLNNNSLKDKPSLELDIPRDTDLIIKGIGFINIKNECKLKVYSDFLEIIELRKSIFK